MPETVGRNGLAVKPKTENYGVRLSNTLAFLQEEGVD